VADRTPRPRPRRAAHLSAVSVNRFGFPHAAQVIRATRKTRDLHTKRWRAVTVDAVTSLGSAQARPARLADLLRGHWAIEALHHVRDVTFAEDACKVPTGAAPHVMATVRNLAIGVLCPGGAGQPRRRARDPHRPLPPWGAARMKPTSRQNDGAVGGGRTRVG
jgi:predicted transposase YbfD/YdcC